MSPDKLRFYHAQAAKMDGRRTWQWMVAWPLVYRYGELVEIIFEYPCLQYKIDMYIPVIRTAIEVDEPHHDYQMDADAQRQREIEANLNCRFSRLPVRAGEESLYGQLSRLFMELDTQILEREPWQVPHRAKAKVITGKMAEGERQRLNEAGIPELVTSMVHELSALGIETTDDLGPVNTANGELGFTVVLTGIRFVVSVRANRSIKTLVTAFDEGVPDRLGITLVGPKQGACPYWVVEDMKRGSLDLDQTKLRFIQFNDLLSH